MLFVSRFDRSIKTFITFSNNLQSKVRTKIILGFKVVIIQKNYTEQKRNSVLIVKFLRS